MSKRSSSYSKRRPPPPASMPTREELGELERLRQSEVVLKAKVRTLELEVVTMKHRLDSLRKAKNTTIVKREREEIRMSSPHLGGRQQWSNHSLTSHPSARLVLYQPTLPPSSPSKHQQLEKEIETLTVRLLAERSSHEKEIGTLNAQILSEEASLEARVRELEVAHGREMTELRSKWEEEERQLREAGAKASAEIKISCEVSDDLIKELERMKKENAELAEKLEELISVNEELRESNLLLQGRCEAFLEDLSVKEAQWSQREERFNAEIRKQWGERYHEWITKAERKMEELQQINKMLQDMLRTKQQNPDLQ